MKTYHLSFLYKSTEGEALSKYSSPLYAENEEDARRDALLILATYTLAPNPQAMLEDKSYLMRLKGKK